jgi:hypothetical protein
VRFSRSLPCGVCLPCVFLWSDGKDFFAMRETHDNGWLQGSGCFSFLNNVVRKSSDHRRERRRRY